VAGTSGKPTDRSIHVTVTAPAAFLTSWHHRPVHHGPGQVKFIDITPLLAELKKVNPVYGQGVLPAAAYGTPADVPPVVVPNMLLVRDNLDANLACVLTRALFDRKPELEKAKTAAKGTSLDNARKTDPVPLHRGAAR
jgi:TRAP-type uncharacterized transport system substrate-binding protein